MFLSAQRSILVDCKNCTASGNNIKMHATYAMLHAACCGTYAACLLPILQAKITHTPRWIHNVKRTRKNAERTTHQNDCKSNWQI